MSPDINVLVTLLFGAGAGGVVAGILNVVKTMRSGKVETEETLLRRIDADNKSQQRLREEAEEEARQARREAEEYRKQRNSALEEAARLRWFMLKNGVEPPKFGDGDDRGNPSENSRVE